MNRYTIEKRDEELVEKFRAVVASKKRRKRLARVRLFGVLLISACVGLILFSNKSPQSSDPEKVANQSNRISLNRMEDVSVPFQKTEEINVPPLEKIELPGTQNDLSSQPPVLEKQPAEPELIIVEKMISDEPVPVLVPRVKTSGKIGISEIPEQISAKTDIHIAEITTCQGVKNKGAISPKSQFSLKQGVNPYVWMDVRSKKTPYKLQHIYYLNGRRYCAVPLAIHYPRMRTWSNVSLRHQYETGQWRVDVVTKKGEVISQVKFTVVP